MEMTVSAEHLAMLLRGDTTPQNPYWKMVAECYKHLSRASQLESAYAVWQEELRRSESEHQALLADYMQMKIGYDDLFEQAEAGLARERDMTAHVNYMALELSYLDNLLSEEYMGSDRIHQTLTDRVAEAHERAEQLQDDLERLRSTSPTPTQIAASVETYHATQDAKMFQDLWQEEQEKARLAEIKCAKATSQARDLEKAVEAKQKEIERLRVQLEKALSAQPKKPIGRPPTKPTAIIIEDPSVWRCSYCGSDSYAQSMSDPSICIKCKKELS